MLEHEQIVKLDNLVNRNYKRGDIKATRAKLVREAVEDFLKKQKGK